MPAGSLGLGVDSARPRAGWIGVNSGPDESSRRGVESSNAPEGRGRPVGARNRHNSKRPAAAAARRHCGNNSRRMLGDLCPSIQPGAVNSTSVGSLTTNISRAPFAVAIPVAIAFMVALRHLPSCAGQPASLGVPGPCRAAAEEADRRGRRSSSTTTRLLAAPSVDTVSNG